jgi:hypothetical protein
MMVGLVKGKDDDSGCVSLVLFDTSTDEDVNLNETIVSRLIMPPLEVAAPEDFTASL